MANGSVPSGGSLDTIAQMLIASFEQESGSDSPQAGGDFSGPYWRATEARLRFGIKPSYALVEIPLASAIDETAPSVAIVAGSPVTGIRHGDFAKVRAALGGAGVSFINGSVTNISHAMKPDHAIIRVEDHRWLLHGFKIIGRFEISGGGGEITYRQGIHAHMNPGKSRANCTIFDGKPVFCPENWGLGDSETPPAQLTAGKASYWTVNRALDYLRFVFANAAALAYTAKFPFITQINPSVIIWPAGLSSSVTEQETEDRKAREMDFEGYWVDNALQFLCEQAGPYSLYMRPVANTFACTLAIVETRFRRAANGSNIYSMRRAAGGKADSTLNQLVAIEGSYEEDSSELFTKLAIAGDMVYIERRASTYETQLEFAWKEDDFTAWKALIKSEMIAGKSAPEAFRNANAKYPKVVSWYRFVETWNFQEGTDQDTFPRCTVSRPPLPALLSTNVDAIENNSGKKPLNIPVFFEFSPNGTDWLLALDHDGFEVDPDGMMKIPALRDAGETFDSLARIRSPEPDDVDNIVPMQIRATFAIPCDHRLVDARKLSSDPTAGVKTDNAKAGGEAERISSHLSRLFYADAATLYQYAQKKQSWPVPEVVTDAEEQNGPIRNDTELLSAHLKKRLADLGRVRRTGRMIVPHLVPTTEPGHMIGSIILVGGPGGEFRVDSCVQEIAFHAAKGQNSTEVILG